MFRLLKSLFSRHSMESEEYDVLDIIAYNSSELVQKLEETEDENVRETLLRNYLENADSQERTIPDFKDDLDWFNVTEPLTFLDSLKGKIVVLDFFTYCCINCLHILPDLKKLESLHSVEDGLVVIGVHSPKFDNEKDSSNILSAIQRYNITHPVVNDSQSSMWIDLKIRCWPTLLVIGPRANPLFVVMGEGHGELLQKYVNTALKFYREKNLISNSSLPVNLSTDLIMSSNLKFPGKIACSKTNLQEGDGEIYAISDSGNNRILIINSGGDVLHKIGGKMNGFIDGDFNTSRFNSPQGVAFLNEYTVIVADTENHAIRKCDLKSEYVETIAGTGVQGHDRNGGKIGKLQDISSPWDVICYKTRDMDISFHMDENSVPEKDVILIAMAGSHQIWALFMDYVIWWKYKKIEAMSCVAIVGNGREENRNNTYPQNASLAQPSGLALDSKTKTLYFADSESSCIRKVSLEDGKVSPVAGGDRNPLNLFAFGDVDGKPSAAKFQHPLGVAFSVKENAIYVSDTYNHKIKKIDAITNDVVTLKILDSNGIIFQFNEPCGLCLDSSENYLYVVDTNNHTIEKVNLKTMSTEPLKLNFHSTKNINQSNVDMKKSDDILKLPIIKMKSDNKNQIKLSIKINFNHDIKLTKDVPQLWNICLPNKLYIAEKENGNIKSDGKFDVIIISPEIKSDEEQFISFILTLNLCSKGACYRKIYSIELPLEFNQNGLDYIDEMINITIDENCIKL